MSAVPKSSQPGTLPPIDSDRWSVMCSCVRMFACSYAADSGTTAATICFLSRMEDSHSGIRARGY
jgi:hypothetical protein